MKPKPLEAPVSGSLVIYEEKIFRNKKIMEKNLGRENCTKGTESIKESFFINFRVKITNE